MIKETPFHPRTSALNETGLWSHWSGYLATDRYQMSDKFEYFAIRNSAAVIDTSPLYKYRIYGKVMMLTHTGVPKALRGRGIAAALVQAALDHARAKGLKVRPDCSYAEAYMQRHPETLDLLND